MAKFNIDKKGYDPQEVDEYINNLYLKYEEKLAEQKDRVIALKGELEALNEKLSGFVKKDEQISKALIYAVEKSEQIENNAKTVYNLEIKRINNLYARWEELLLEIESKYPDVNKNRYLKSILNEFKAAIADINSKSLTFNSKGIKEELHAASDGFIKNILNRMDYVVNSKPEAVVGLKAKKANVNMESVAKIAENVPLKTKPQTIQNVAKTQPVSLPKPKVEPQKSVTNILPKGEVQKKSFELKTTKVAPTLETNRELPTKKSFELNLSKPQSKVNPEKLQPIKNEKPAPKSMLAISSISNRLSKLNSIQNVKTNLEKPKTSERVNVSKTPEKPKLEKRRATPFNYMVFPEPNESGFDLKEALNPKEDLDEIMKSFNFSDED